MRLSILAAGLLAVLLSGAASEAVAAPRPISSCTTISSPGSYILTRNINGTAALVNCITINAPHVTLDLDGFGIGGPGVIGGAPGGHGILVQCCENVAIRNGSVAGWVSGVVYVAGAEGAVIEGVRAYDNELTGIGVTSEGALIRNNIAQNNGNNGISFELGSRVIGNVANNNGNRGIQGRCDSTVMSNTAVGNVADNLFLIGGITADCVVVDNTAP